MLRYCQKVRGDNSSAVLKVRGDNSSVVKRLWVNGQFQFHQWNYFDFEGPRTNNYVEGWHSRLKKVVGKPHPNIFELIEIIKKEEATAQMKLQICESGATGPPRR